MCRLMCLFALVGALAGAEITLRDGRILTGTILPDSAPGVVDLEVRLGDMVMVQHIEEHRIRSIDYGMSPQEEERAAILARAEELGDGGSSEDWWALVERARTLGDSLLARQMAERVALRDRHHVEAHRLLGLRRNHGIWMKPREEQIAAGRIFREGTWWEPMAWEAELEQRAERLAQWRAEREARARERVAAAERASSLPPPSMRLRYRGDSYLYRYGPLLGYYGYHHPYPVHYGGGFHAGSISTHRHSQVRVRLGGGDDSFRWSLDWSW